MAETITPRARQRGRNIARLRKDAGFKSQKALAKALGIKNRTHIAEWERGKVAPSTGYMEDMARLFGVPVSEIGESYHAVSRRTRHESVGESSSDGQSDTLTSSMVGSSSSGALPGPLGGVIEMNRYPQPELLEPFLAMWSRMDDRGRLACFHTAVSQVAPGGAGLPLARINK